MLNPVALWFNGEHGSEDFKAIEEMSLGPSTFGEGLKELVSLELKWLNISTIITLIGWISVCVSFSPLFEDVGDIFLCIQVFDGFHYSSILKFLYFFTLYVMGYVTAASCLDFEYFTRTIYIEFLILSESQNQISDEFPIDERLIDDGIYQEIVYRKLHFHVRQYVALDRYIQKSVDNLVPYLILFVLVGSLTSLNICFFLMQYWLHLSFLQQLRWICIGFYLVLLVLIFCICCQGIIDESEKFKEAVVKSPWVLWNKKNRKVILLMLTMLDNRTSLKIAGIEANYALILQILKFSCSYSLTLYQLKNS